MPRRTKVTWKVDRKKHAPIKRRPYYPDASVPEDKKELFERMLVPGGLFLVKNVLRVETGFDAVQFPYIIESWYATDAIVAKPGQLAMYAGTVRVEEEGGKGTAHGIVRVPRHSFIINGGRYLVLNLNWLDPVVGQEKIQ